MTTDLFYTQFLSLDDYVINDKRDTKYEAAIANTSNISFYAEIQEDANNNWECTLNAIKLNENKNVSSTKKYSSYYKILLDAKASLENLLLNLSDNNSNIENQFKQTDINQDNLDSLTGNWKGEEQIDKILILRGGRGFIVFKNGASMNVSVKKNNNKIEIKQESKPNASFFPELPRQVALKNASSAPPIIWEFTLTGNNVLKGKKHTLQQDNTDLEKVISIIQPVTWTKIK